MSSSTIDVKQYICERCLFLISNFKDDPSGIHKEDALKLSKEKLEQFYEQNKIRLEEARKNLKVFGIPYPQMKMLDMGFWQIGFINENDRSKKAH